MASKRSPREKLVLVEWVDSCSHAGVWKGPADLENTGKTCFTVGWLIKDSRGAVTIVSSAGMHEDGFDQVSGDMTIPRGCIVRTKVLARGRL